MVASAVRELSASTDPVLIAGAFCEKTVQIWDPKSLEKISGFTTVFFLGAGNLAFAPSARLLVAGVSGNAGRIAAYEVPSGRVLWKRGVVFPSSLRFEPSGESVLCSSRNRSIIRLDVHSGKTVEVRDGLAQSIEGAYGDRLDVPADGSPFRILRHEREVEVSRGGFALLDVQFSRDAVCLAEAGGPVRCINRADGSERWRFDPGANTHVLRLHYSPGMDAFFGIARHLVDTGWRRVLRFSAGTGACEQICSLDESWEEVFLSAVDQVVTSSGEIRDLSNGVLVGRLPFPMTEYPDE